ncbi:MAG: T9SS type A sorting domain-containing protein [Chitinophagales bacterium]|nr:T9SS type A sorting domain-containing protein [Chitinophagales bacterium]
MKKTLLIILSVLFFKAVLSQTVVDSVNAQYRNGQTFIKWNVIPEDIGFYYTYSFDHPITNSNIDSAKYVGRVPHDFSLNYFLTLGTQGMDTTKPERYLVINRDPLDSLDVNHCVFVATCSKNKTVYYAVTSDSLGLDGTLVENRYIIPGKNSTTTGVSEIVAQIEPVLQIDNLPVLIDSTLSYDAYTVFGGNVKTEYTPEMTNEGCLSFNFGIVPDENLAGANAATFFFYGGGGNSYENVSGLHIDGLWQISMEDVIPNFNWDSIAGENTKWLGYNENIDIYSVNEDTPPPTTGVVKGYTIHRLAWTRNWLVRRFPEDIDSTRISVFGTSNGTIGALALSYYYPEWISACDIVNTKVNAQYLNDDNPLCKWNENGSSREHADIFLGTLESNLPSDLPKINGEGNYSMWEWANFNNLLRDNKYRSLPFIYLTSGKEDIVTCWEEKIEYYNSINAYRSGGRYAWDLRQHKIGHKSIKDNPFSTLARFSTRTSYPAFSNCSMNQDPGDTHNPNPPYYDGDTVGSINGVMEFVDSTIFEYSEGWQTLVHTNQWKLTDGTLWPLGGLPPYVRVDITPRRLQEFINLPSGSIICMENWEGSVLKQSRSMVYHPGSSEKGLITFRKARIRQEAEGGNLIKIYKCGGPQVTSSPLISLKSAIDNVYPNPTSGNITIEVSMVHHANVIIFIENLFGARVMQLHQGLLAEGDHQVSVDMSDLLAGMYIITVNAGGLRTSYKIIKE